MKIRLSSALCRLFVLSLTVVSFGLLSLGVGVAPASAANNGLYSVFPATPSGSNPRVWFNYLVNPGTVIKDSVTVTNQTPQSIAFKLYPVDAINAQGGGFAFNPPQAPLRTVGAWVQLSDLEFTLPPHSLANVPFTMRVPQGETPGDYAGGIVLSPVYPAVERRGAFTFNVYNNVGTRIYLRVAGPLHPSLSITKLSIGTSGFAGLLGGPVSSTVTYTVTNTGNEILNPTAKLSVSPLVGSATEVPPKIYSSLLPHNSVTATYKFPSKEAFLRFSANLTLITGAAKDTNTAGSATAWVVPWLLILIILILIALLWLWRRRRRKAEEGPEEGEGGPSGTEAEAAESETAASGSTEELVKNATPAR